MGADPSGEGLQVFTLGIVSFRCVSERCSEADFAIACGGGGVVFEGAHILFGWFKGKSQGKATMLIF